MNTDVILELIDIAVSLAQSQFTGSDLKRTLLDIVDHAVDAYNEHTDGYLDTELIAVEGEL